MKPWQPIETVPDGERVLLWWEKGENGNGGMETAYVYHNPNSPTGLDYWTHGGPNAGTDWEPSNNERPLLWRYPPPDPSDIISRREWVMAIVRKAMGNPYNGSVSWIQVDYGKMDEEAARLTDEILALDDHQHTDG